jgi:hypothetical protein
MKRTAPVHDQLETYRTQSFWSDPGRWAPLVAEIPPVPEVVVRVVSGLLCHPFLAPMRNVELPASAEADRGIRSVETMLERLLSRDNRPLTVSRTPESRFFCVCSGFARLAASIFRAHSIPARCRVGFAAYFTPGFLEDHWVCEYWDEAAQDWKLGDAQIDDVQLKLFDVDFDLMDVPRDKFLVAGDAWRLCRDGDADPAKFGLSIMNEAGYWWIAANLLRDVAALNNMEMLPWDVWGAMPAPDETIGDEQYALFDRLAELTRVPDATFTDLAAAYTDDPRVRVPPTVRNAILNRAEPVLDDDRGRLLP